MFALVVRFDIRDEEFVALFDQLTAEVLEQIKIHEPGTLVYATARVEGEPLARIFYQAYADKEHAFQTHEAAPYVVQFHARKNPLLAGQRVEFLTPALAKGLPNT